MCLDRDAVLSRQYQRAGRLILPGRTEAVFLKLNRMRSGIPKVPTHSVQAFVVRGDNATNDVTPTVLDRKYKSDRFLRIFSAERIPGRIMIIVTLPLCLLLALPA